MAQLQEEWNVQEKHKSIAMTKPVSKWSTIRARVDFFIVEGIMTISSKISWPLVRNLQELSILQLNWTKYSRKSLNLHT